MNTLILKLEAEFSFVFGYNKNSTSLLLDITLYSNIVTRSKAAKWNTFV